MKRGDMVCVELAGGEQVERAVWEAAQGRIVVCTVEAYRRWERYGEPPTTLGFGARFVRVA